jgi:hypothetical protein
MLAEGKNVETTEGAVPPVTEETPHFRNISMKNITCRGAEQAIYLQGLPELNLENVTLENIDMTAESGMACIDSKGIRIRNMRLVTDKKPMLRFINSSDVDISGLMVAEETDGLFDIFGENSHAITIENITPDGKVSVRKFE